MKPVYILLLTLTLGQAYGMFNPKADVFEQDRPFVIEYVVAELNRVHGAVFELPFDKAYIISTLVPEIEAQRLIIAPNFPAVELNGTDLVVNESLTQWYAAHQAEFLPYIEYVDKFVIDHK